MCHVPPQNRLHLSKILFAHSQQISPGILILNPHSTAPGSRHSTPPCTPHPEERLFYDRIIPPPLLAQYYIPIFPMYPRLKAARHLVGSYPHVELINPLSSLLPAPDKPCAYPWNPSPRQLQRSLEAIPFLDVTKITGVLIMVILISLHTG